MQFIWMGYLKPEQPIDQAVQQQISEFLQQPYIAINAAGMLRGPLAERSGNLVVFEAEDRAAAEAPLRESQVRNASLHSEYHLFEFQNQLG